MGFLSRFCKYVSNKGKSEIALVEVKELVRNEKALEKALK